MLHILKILNSILLANSLKYAPTVYYRSWTNIYFMTFYNNIRVNNLYVTNLLKVRYISTNKDSAPTINRSILKHFVLYKYILRIQIEDSWDIPLFCYTDTNTLCNRINANRLDAIINIIFC